jgi:hypothetical protein
MTGYVWTGRKEFEREQTLALHDLKERIVLVLVVLFLVLVVLLIDATIRVLLFV